LAGGYRELDHPADIALEVWGDDLLDLLRSATCALLSVWLKPDGLEGISRSSPRVEGRESIEVVDEFDLLIQWLNRVLLAPQLKLRLPHHVLDLDVRGGVEGDFLQAEISYEALTLAKGSSEALWAREIKSVTYGGGLNRDPSGRYRALLILDI